MCFTSPQLTTFFAILNKRIRNVYFSNQAAIWGEKFKKYLPQIQNPGKNYPSFRMAFV